MIRRIKEQCGQTIAITMMVTMLMLLLSAAVVTSVIQNMREASQSKSLSIQNSAAEFGLETARNEINRATYYMTKAIWTVNYNPAPNFLNKYFCPRDASGANPLKFYDCFKDLQRWPGFSVNDGWFPLPYDNEFDKYYHFTSNPGSAAVADEVIGEAVNDASLAWKQHFLTLSMKKGVNYSTAPDSKMYATRNSDWYKDRLSLSYASALNNYGTTGPNKSLILKKLYTFRGEKPAIRVAVYVRLNLEDYITGNPLDAENYVKFSISAVSEATLEAPCRYASGNMTINMGSATTSVDIDNLIKSNVSDSYPYDPGCYPPVLSWLAGGSTVSGLVFQATGDVIDPLYPTVKHWWADGRIFLYEQPIATGIFKDLYGLGSNGLSTDSVFVVGFDYAGTNTYHRYYLSGPRPPLAFTDGNFIYDPAVATDDGLTVADLNVAKAYVRKGNPEATDQANNLAGNLWLVKHASGYYGSSGRFFIQRRGSSGNLVGFSPRATDCCYFASAHYLATGDVTVPIPYRIGTAASASNDTVHY